MRHPHEYESLLMQHQRQEPARMSGMSVASSIDRPISRAPSRSNLGPSAGSQHGHSHSSGSEEVRHILPARYRHAELPVGCAPGLCKLGRLLVLGMSIAGLSGKCHAVAASMDAIRSV